MDCLRGQQGGQRLGLSSLIRSHVTARSSGAGKLGSHGTKARTIPHWPGLRTDLIQVSLKLRT